MIFYKYQGAGNDFLIADNRDGHIKESNGALTALQEGGNTWSKHISELCDRRYGIGADGLMLLEAGSAADGTDFHMTYFNSDGSGGMMCGNGGRCIVAFAEDCDVPADCLEGIKKYVFTAADGLHEAFILEKTQSSKVIRLKMKDVSEVVRYESLSEVTVPSDGYFLDTGTRHYVRFVGKLGEYDVVGEGREIRWKSTEFQPVGANVNFVEAKDGVLNVRTYEKGVEDETFACGTGIVASAVAAHRHGIAPGTIDADGRAHYPIRAKRDSLAVDFLPCRDAVAREVFLTGPAAHIGKIIFE